jgi:hypothetical protein
MSIQKQTTSVSSQSPRPCPCARTHQPVDQPTRKPTRINANAPMRRKRNWFASSTSSGKEMWRCQTARTVEIGVVELLEPLRKLEVVLEAPLHQPFHRNHLVYPFLFERALQDFEVFDVPARGRCTPRLMSGNNERDAGSSAKCALSAEAASEYDTVPLPPRSAGTS